MKNIKYLLRFVFILTLAFFVSQSVVSSQGKYFDDRVLEKLDLKEGMIVADVGAGNGKFSVKIARIVGLEGHVYANEIDEDEIRKIKNRIEDQGIENITIIYGEEEDAVLPVKVDFIVLKFVYHHLSSPDNFMNNLLKYLNPGGRLAVIAADINHDNSDRENEEDMDPCISDPEKTKKAIEKSGFQFVKREDVKQSKEVDYILFFKASIMKSDGIGVRQLTNNEFCDFLPRWSPDSTRFIFSSDRHQAFKWEVYVMNVDGTDVRRVTHSPTGVTAINPVWKLN